MRQRVLKQAQRGFTLTEVLVALAVFTAIFIAALLVYDRANRVFKSSVDASDVQQTTRVAFDRLVADLRMAGFDFDRDGFPMGTRKYQQPDEQLEFIHPRAVTIRTNLNYESAAAADNGRETAYEPGFGTTATDEDDFFPVVTTANNEIITYVLKSDSGPNNDTIEFFADVAKPRRTYPDTGGANETLVQIPNVNLCVGGCLNPPYTLYRIALKDDGTPDTPVPVANNIRSLSFSYFADALSSTPIAPNGGVGRFVVTGGLTPQADIVARELRGGIRSIRLDLVGMSPGSDASYVEPIEAALPTAERVAAAQRHRQYRLQSTIVPRNLGKRGVQELDTRVPGSPSITAVCSEGCGAPKVQWTAPPVGYVDSYVIYYDDNPNGSFNSPPTDAGRNLFGYPKNLDPNTAYYFKVQARNPFGSGISVMFPPLGFPGIKPINRTKPNPPEILSVTGDPSGTGPAAIPSNIIVTWRAPSSNAGSPLNSCNFQAAAPDPAEIRSYRVYRSTTADFTPAAANMIWSGATDPVTGPALRAVDSAIVTFTDATPKEACKTYYYKVVGIERCNDAPELNFPQDVTHSVSGASNEVGGQALAGGNPIAPQNVRTTIASTCSTDPCSIALEWNEVTEDVNGQTILVKEYNVHRQAYLAGVPTGAAIDLPTTDVVTGDGIVSFTDTTAPAPIDGRVYHYNVTARHCTDPPGFLTSAVSSPDVKFPCAVLVATGNGAIDGDGSGSNPWLVNGAEATIDVTSSAILVTATALVYADPSAPAGSGVAARTTFSGTAATFSFAMAGMSAVFRVDMQFTDVNGCASTITRYVQESPSPCCLVPYKLDATTIFDASVLSVTSNRVTVTLKNQCDLALAIDTLQLRWTFGAQGNDLRSITYLPSNLVDNFGGVDDTDGVAAIDPRVVGAPTTIPANGSYQVVLEFQRNQTSLDTVTNFCARYDQGGLADECRVVQTPGASCQ